MNRFDESARRKLEGLEVERPADAWQRFTEQMPHSPEAEEGAFDQFMRKQLSRHQAHFEARGWRDLRHSLDLQSLRLRELTRAKSFEFILLLLLVFPLLHWLPLTPPSAPEPAPLRHDGPIATSPLFQGDPAQPVGTSSFLYDPPLDIPDNAATDHHAARGELSLPSAGSDKGIAPLSSIQSPQLATAHVSASPALFEDNEVRSDLQPAYVSSDRSMAPPNLLTTVVAAPSLAAAKPDLATLAAPAVTKSTKHRISLALQADVHHITTPYDALLGNRGYDQLAMGYGGMISYSREGPTWGLRTQMSYRHLYYLPKPFTEIFEGDLLRGYFSEQIRNIELNLVSLGLYGTRSIGRMGSWHLYGLAGATCHMAVLASYDRRQEFHPGAQTPQPIKAPEPTSSSLTSQKRFPDGLFEHGPFLENAYLSIDAGLGMERHFGGRLSLFIEPVLHYNPFRQSLGPNNDRINTLSIFSGARVLL
jgi:hypothetical protein